MASDDIIFKFQDGPISRSFEVKIGLGSLQLENLYSVLSLLSDKICSWVTNINFTEYATPLFDTLN